MIVSSAIGRNKPGAFFERPSNFQYWTIALFLKGAQSLRICADSILTRKNLLLIVPPLTPYSFETVRESWDVWATFDPEEHMARCLQGVTAGDSGYGAHDLGSATFGREIARAIKDMQQWRSEPTPLCDLAENALERALLLLEKSVRDMAKPESDARVSEVITFIHENFDQPLPMSLLAKRAHLSTSRFAHLFRASQGISPALYVERYRMARARDLLLSTNQGIGEIALATGFPNSFHFSTRFRKMFGQSPRAFRRSPVCDHHSIRPSRPRNPRR